MTMRVVIASFRGAPPEFRDDDLLLDCLSERGIEASAIPWDDATTDWSAFDLVVARTVWDYTLRYDEFIAWLTGIDAVVENEPELIRWNTDKTYLGDFAAAGVPVVET